MTNNGLQAVEKEKGPGKICHRIVFGVYTFARSMNLRFDTRQKTFLDVVQNRVVLNNIQVLNLSNELLVRVLARATHHRVGHLLGLHLLGNLASSCSGLDIGDIDFCEGHLPLSLPRRKT